MLPSDQPRTDDADRNVLHVMIPPVNSFAAARRQLSREYVIAEGDCATPRRRCRPTSASNIAREGVLLGSRQMQAVLGATLQEIGGLRRPFVLAKIDRFALIEIATEVAAE